MRTLSIFIIIILILLTIIFVLGGYYGGALGTAFISILLYFKAVKKEKA